MVKIDFYDVDFTPSEKLTYSVIAARYRGRWVFVKHHERSTFEIPGGHIEKNETSIEAARRELNEETGAIMSDLVCVCTYSVNQMGETRFGRLYYAEITQMGPVPDLSEIEEIIFLESLPDPVTYPEIQPHLFRKVLDYLNLKD